MINAIYSKGEKMNKKERQINKIVEKIHGQCDDFLGYVYSAKNQCAWTDRTVENIIELSKLLEETYNSLFKEVKQ